MFDTPVAINHVAIALPSREAWLKQLAFMQSRGIEFKRRVNHGVTHSLYIADPNGYGVELLYELPREMWEGDINEALNWVENLPTEGRGGAGRPHRHAGFRQGRSGIIHSSFADPHAGPSSLSPRRAERATDDGSSEVGPKASVDRPRRRHRQSDIALAPGPRRSRRR